MTPPPSDPDAGPHGPPVDAAEMLLRVIAAGAAALWIKPDGTASSLLFNPPKFSVDIESLSSVEKTLGRWPSGSGVAAFPAGGARTLGFDARHEPEHGNAAHANVYSDLGTSQRKKSARSLAALTVIRVPPVGSGGP